MPKKGGLDSLLIQGRLGKKEGGGVFEGGLIPQCPPWISFSLFSSSFSCKSMPQWLFSFVLSEKKSPVGDSFTFVIQFCCKITFVSTLQQQKSSQKLVLEMPLTDEKSILHDHGIRAFLSCPFKGQNMYAVYLLCPFDLENSWPKWNHGTYN